MNKIVLLLLLTSLSFISVAETVIVVNKDNSIDKIKPSDIRKIFLAKKLSFENGNEATPLMLDDISSSTLFLDKIIRKTPTAYRKYFAKLHFRGGSSAPTKVSAEEMLKKVSTDTSAIGFIEKQLVNDSVKVVYEF